jgi:AcrR family transcriptional regulator
VTNIYWYFRSKDDPLDMMTERAMAELDGNFNLSQDLPWHDYVRTYFRQFHDTLSMTSDGGFEFGLENSIRGLQMLLDREPGEPSVARARNAMDAVPVVGRSQPVRSDRPAELVRLLRTALDLG